MTTTTAVTSELSPEQHQRRRGFIGGTDAPRILGVSPWGGPLQVYEEKMGLRDRPLAGPAAHWGHLLEDTVAAEWSRTSGFKVRRLSKPVIHPDHSFIGGYLDRRIVGEPAFLEVKTTSAFGASDWGPPGSDEVPDDYWVQVQHYLAVTGMKWAAMAALIGGQRLVPYRITRNEKFIEGLIDAEVTFWHEHIEKAVPPPVTGHPSDSEYLGNRYPASMTGTILPATPEDEELIRRLLVAKRVLKEQEAEVRLHENRLKDRIGLDAGIAGAAGVITWKSQTRRTTNWKAVAHDWRNLLGLYVPSDEWERLSVEAQNSYLDRTTEQSIRVLRVKGEDDDAGE